MQCARATREQARNLYKYGKILIYFKGTREYSSDAYKLRIYKVASTRNMVIPNDDLRHADKTKIF